MKVEKAVFSDAPGSDILSCPFGLRLEFGEFFALFHGSSSGV